MKRRARDLHWGPFAVGATATLLLAFGAVGLAGLSVGHWWFWPLVVVLVVGLVLLGASAVGALVRRDP